MKSFKFKELFEGVKEGGFNKEKIKQVSLGIIACLLFAVGFMNYNKAQEKLDQKYAVVENENADMIGDVKLVSSESVVQNDIIMGAIVGNDVMETAEIGSKYVENQEAENAESSLDYFENVRIDRDSMYSRMLETYNKMINNDNLAETQKAIAVKEIEKITNNQNAIMIAENLIKNKGFEDAVILANTDIINVIVKAPVLSNEDIGKIQNIIEREFGTSLENVNISSKN